MNAIVSIGVAEMCNCTSCSTYCTRFCSYSAFSIATEMCAVGTARGAAAHFHETNRNYGTQRSYYQSFKSILCRIWHVQSFEVEYMFEAIHFLRKLHFFAPGREMLIPVCPNYCKCFLYLAAKY